MIENSILTSVKKVLGIDESYTVFDQDIMIHINSVLNTLTQLGVGPENGFRINDATTVWTDFYGEDLRYNSVQSYMYLRVRMLFDPPPPATMTMFKEMIKELEWRINVQREDITYVPPIPDLPEEEDFILDGGGA